MDIFSVLSMIGGLAMFLYGMETMGDGLAKTAGGKLEHILEKLTSTPIKGVLLGAAVTAVIQSSSATTVMVVGFVNSGIMKLSQAVGIIMGANIGTTVTSWIVSLSGIESSNIVLQFLKPTSFCPILALIGIILLMFTKDEKKHDIGGILLGFAVLMFGMDAMSNAVKPLADVPEFTSILTMFSNPVLGMIAGCRPYGSDPIFFGIRWYFAGTLCYRQRYLRYSTSDHHGTEYRYLYHGIDLCNRSKEECQACGFCPLIL